MATPGLKLYNTLTRSKAPFVPIDPANVRMYVCGPTVYDFAHIGNARPIIVFDVLYRLLRHIYGAGHVTYVRNITDVDDKINARAAEEYPDLALNDAINKVTMETTKQFHADIAAFGVLEPDVEPRCTGHIPQMVAMIEVLIEKGHAYEAEGHVLLDTLSVPDYGRLSGRSLDEMIAGARVEVAPYKRNPSDSVLWKPSTDEQPGWESPWGRGRPGWHIECSAMAKEHLGEIFDIHGGGIDLQFPHHENELAQSCSAHGTDIMANVWMHNGFLQVEGEKMSKSLGNFVTINEVLQSTPGEAVRLAMLGTQYRQPIDWTAKAAAEARRTLDNWVQLTTDVKAGNPDPDFTEALCDDMNTPKAISILHELRREAANGNSEAARTLKGSAQMIGLLQLSADAWNAWRPAEVEIDETEIKKKIEQRAAAKADKDFATADSIRDELTAMGVTLKDGPDGTTWEIAR
ncbi:MAG: cysteine--tRNA ligase [Hyphomicrobiaceae bacterium]